MNDRDVLEILTREQAKYLLDDIALEDQEEINGILEDWENRCIIKIDIERKLKYCIDFLAENYKAINDKDLKELERLNNLYQTEKRRKAQKLNFVQL